MKFGSEIPFESQIEKNSVKLREKEQLKVRTGKVKAKGELSKKTLLAVFPVEFMFQGQV